MKAMTLKNGIWRLRTIDPKEIAKVEEHKRYLASTPGVDGDAFIGKNGRAWTSACSVDGDGKMIWVTADGGTR